MARGQRGEFRGLLRPKVAGMAEPVQDPIVLEAARLARLEQALDKAVSSDRMGTYLAAAAGDPARARALYVWDRDVSAALLADIAILEVAVRNAMHAALAAGWSERWYENAALWLDDRSMRQLENAWKDLPSDVKRNRHDVLLPGRLVARCMFGFWTNLLDAGSFVGREPRRTATDYEALWRSHLSKAFLGGRAQARASGARYTRSWAHEQLRLVNVVRNRAAHHEPFVNGCPVPGQASRRLTAQEAHDACLVLARMLDRDLAAWLSGSTRVPSVLAARP